MTNEDEILAEAERIVNDADAVRKKETLAEHKRAIPMLAGMAKSMELSVYDRFPYESNVHVFMMRPDPDGNRDEAVGSIAGPDTDPDDTLTASFSHVHAFADVSDTSEKLQDMRASIVLHEMLGSRTEFGLFMTIKDKWFAMWAGGKLTVAKRAGGDFVIKVAQPHTDGDPESFFKSLGCPTKTVMAITALMYFQEAGRLLKEDMPSVYRQMADRIINKLQAEDGDE